LKYENCDIGERDEQVFPR